MKPLWTAAVAMIALAGCAGLEPAGRNAQRDTGPVVASAPPPAPRATPQPTYTPPPVQTQQAPAVVASNPPARTVQPPPAQTVQPPPARTVQAPPPSQVASNVQVPTPRPAPRANDDEIVVPGGVTRQVPPPAGDPRSVSERMQDINSWDRCVTRVQASFESDPTRAQLDTPEEVCRQSLGMADRNAVPDSRTQRRSR